MVLNVHFTLDLWRLKLIALKYCFKRHHPLTCTHESTLSYTVSLGVAWWRILIIIQTTQLNLAATCPRWRAALPRVRFVAQEVFGAVPDCFEAQDRGRRGREDVSSTSASRSGSGEGYPTWNESDSSGAVTWLMAAANKIASYHITDACKSNSSVTRCWIKKVSHMFQKVA